ARLKSADAATRVAAIEELLEIAAVRLALVKPVIPEVVAALKDADANVRRTAAVALSNLEPEPARVVPPLSTLLVDTEDRTVRIAAANSLAAFGLHAEPALPALAAIQTKENAKEEGQRDADLLNTVNQAIQGIEQSIVDELNYYAETVQNDMKV